MYCILVSVTLNPSIFKRVSTAPDHYNERAISSTWSLLVSQVHLVSGARHLMRRFGSCCLPTPTIPQISIGERENNIYQRLSEFRTCAKDEEMPKTAGNEEDDQWHQIGILDIYGFERLQRAWLATMIKLSRAVGEHRLARMVLMKLLDWLIV